MATKYSAEWYRQDRPPVPVRIPGTDEWTLREIEHDAKRCTKCKRKARTLYSYDDSCQPFCKIGHWVSYILRDIVKSSRRRKAAELAVVRDAERTIRAADKRRRQKSELDHRMRTGQVHVG